MHDIEEKLFTFQLLVRLYTNVRKIAEQQIEEFTFQLLVRLYTIIQ